MGAAHLRLPTAGAVIHRSRDTPGCKFSRPPEFPSSRKTAPTARQVAVLLSLCARPHDFHRRHGLSVLDPGAAMGNTSWAGVYGGGYLFWGVYSPLQSFWGPRTTKHAVKGK